MRYLIALMLFTTQAFAMDWSDLEVGQTYKLTQSFQLKQTERSGSLIDITKGEEVELKTIVPLMIPGFPMIAYVFDYKNCPGPEMVTEQEIIPVDNTSPLAEIGVMLDSPCEIQMYLELKDYYSNTLVE